LIEQAVACIVYVDSGSTDGSPEMGRALGVVVEDLDTSIPFTMARGRNAGFRALLETNDEIDFVQFVDGDCEVDSNWIRRGVELLEQRPDVVTVCGFRRERFPHQSVYNRLADMEWRGPSGEISACGGDAIYRVAAFRAVTGFDESMIAGEEAALCAKLRKSGGKIWRLDCPMTVHDAAMTEFHQWWTRNVRTGHAFAENAIHHASPHDRRQLRSILALGLVAPCALVTGTLILNPWLRVILWTGGLGLYAQSGLGAFRSRMRLGDGARDSALYAAFCVMGKFPETQGVLKFLTHHVRGSRARIIEYKL
jgi:GT2 family glycosyltransferase